MIFTRSLCIAAALLLAGCGEAAPEPPPLARAQTALERGDGMGAEIALRDLLAAGVPPAELAAYLGEAELLQGNRAEARRWLSRRQFAAGTEARGHHMLGRLAMQEGDLAAAGEAFDRALAAAPDAARVWVDIGRLRYRGGEQKQAIAASRKALALDPADPEALLFRAQLVRDSEGLSAALPLFERGLQTAPESPVLLAEYAATLADLGRARDSLAAVRRLAEVDPRNPRVFFIQAVIAARGGDYDLARGLLLRSGDLDREMPAAMLLSGVIDLENANFASAAQTFDRLAVVQPDNARVRQLLARTLLLGGNHRELVHRFEARAGSPYLAQLVGRAYEKLGDRAKAAPYLDLAAQTLSGSPAAIPAATPLAVAQSRGIAQGSDALSIVRGLIGARQPAEAAAKAAAFAARYPGSADAIGLAGDAAFAAGDPRAALERYARAGQIRRPWPAAKRQAAALFTLGDAAGVERLLSDYLAGDPANAEAAALLARSAYLRGDFSRAGVLIDHALRNGGDRDPMLHALRAEIALREGADDRALAHAAEAYRLQPMNPAAARTLAVALAGPDGVKFARAEAMAAKARALAGETVLARR